MKININGPFVSDTAFINKYKKYDVIIGMYHDQVLSPFKTLFNLMQLILTIRFKIFKSFSRSWCSKKFR